MKRIANHPLVVELARNKSAGNRLRSIYFDTPDFSLPGLGVVLRVRSQEGRWIQTVKTAGKASGGFHQRGEFESRVADATPDYARLVSEHGLELFSDPGLVEALSPIFETDFWRSSWDLCLPCGSVVELSLDDGEVKADTETTPICEMELELKQGRPEVLYEIALEIAKSVHMRLENVSKAERGYALLRKPTPTPSKKNAAKVKSDMTVEEAYAAILEGSLAQIQGNESVILETDNPEGVHQMRIGLRRFRTCLSLFRKWVPGEFRTNVRDEINVFRSVLGEARDWDVFLENHHPYLAALDRRRDDWRVLLAAAEHRRSRQYLVLRDVLSSSQYHLSMLRLSAWVHCRGWRESIDPGMQEDFQQPLRTQVNRMLSRGHRGVLRRYDEARTGNPEALHQLRIAVKRQRYAVEFFRRMGPRSQVKKYRRAVRGLQELLGHLNDASVAAELLRTLEPGREFDSNLSCSLDWNELMFGAYLERLPQAWKRFSRQRKFWK